MNANGGIETFIYYIYDASGIAGLFVNNSYYYFTKNLFGDIIGIKNEANELVGAYTYNAWGECTVKTNVDGIATLNPFRYRGYYYDTETGFYYLQTRYYDPDICRFISADDPEILGDLASVVGQLNLYAYCLNNPVMFTDPSGYFPVLAVVLGCIAVVGLGLTIGGVAADNNTLTSVGLGMVGVAALVSGGIAFAGAIASGATLTYIIGGVTMLAGAGSLTFMSSEIQEASGNGNWMIDAGMSEGLYNGLLIGTAIVATLGTCASSIAHSFNINSIQKVGNLQGTQYKGIRFTQKTRSGGMRVRTLEYHTHFHRGYKPHWQLNKWDGFIRRGAEGRWSWWLKRI